METAQPVQTSHKSGISYFYFREGSAGILPAAPGILAGGAIKRLSSETVAKV